MFSSASLQCTVSPLAFKLHGEVDWSQEILGQDDWNAIRQFAHQIADSAIDHTLSAS